MTRGIITCPRCANRLTLGPEPRYRAAAAGALRFAYRCEACQHRRMRAGESAYALEPIARPWWLHIVDTGEPSPERQRAEHELPTIDMRHAEVDG